MAPQVDVRIVIVAVIGIISVIQVLHGCHSNIRYHYHIQYVSWYQSYHSAISYALQQARYRSQVSDYM